MNSIKKIAISVCCLFFSLSAFADPVSPDFFQFTKRILTDDLQPLVQMATTISYLIGLFLIIGGMTRLYRHGSGAQNMMQRASPMATAMYFVVGVVLISYVPYLQIIANSIFGSDPIYTQMCPQISNLIPTLQPTPSASGGVSQYWLGFSTSSNDFCPMMAYSKDVSTADTKGDVGAAIKYLIYGVMFLVGIISFIRGMLHLLKIGEGGGQGQGVGKALTHIFAGIVAVNAPSFYSLMENVLLSNTAGAGT